MQIKKACVGSIRNRIIKHRTALASLLTVSSFHNNKEDLWSGVGNGFPHVSGE
jgi:hypothetical protein